MFTSKKKENLIKILTELTGNKDGNTRKDIHAASTQVDVGVAVKPVNIVIEIPQLSSLVQEIRSLRETIQEFVNLIKSRLEQTESSQDESTSQ